MLRQYVKWQLRKWWPLILIIGLAIALPFVSTLQSASLTETVYKAADAPRYASSGEGLLLASFVVAGVIGLGATFVVPVFVFVYRTSLQAVDCFYQAGFDKRTIRRTRTLIGLGIILAAFLAAFLLGVFILLMRYLATPVVEESGNYVRTRLDINFGFVLLAGLFLVIVIAAQYFINCFLASLGDSALVQIMLMLCGFAILTLGVGGPLMYGIAAYGYLGQGTYSILDVTPWEFGPVNFMASFYQFLTAPVVGRPKEWRSIDWQYLVGLLIGLGLAGGAGTYLMLCGEPSGEYAGHWRPRNLWISLIPHIASVTIGFALAAGLGATSGILSIIGSYSLMLLYCVVYYALLALMRKSFKPSKVDLIAYLCVVGTILIAFIAMTAIASAHVTTPQSQA